jgi:hypothetical protein
MGMYPMLLDETCFFLAVDFNKGSWHADASAFLDACRLLGIPAALERSRSRNGAHVCRHLLHNTKLELKLPGADHSTYVAARVYKSASERLHEQAVANKERSSRIRARRYLSCQATKSKRTMF